MAGTKVEPLANDKSRVDPLLPAPHSSGPSRPTQTQLDSLGDSEDHVLIPMSDVQEDAPGIGGARNPTKTPDQPSASKKQAPLVPTKPAYLRRDSKATAYPQSACTTSPTSPQSTVADSGVNAGHGALPPPPRRKPVMPVKHEGATSLPPLPDWAKSPPSSESTGSSWKEKGKAAMNNITAVVVDTFKSRTQPPPSFVVAIMGVTGSGKSQFIKHVTGRDVGVSSSLNSCKP
jgi:hypothetical protein